MVVVVVREWTFACVWLFRYLKYLGWLLNDRDAHVRLATLVAIIKLLNVRYHLHGVLGQRVEQRCELSTWVVLGFPCNRMIKRLQK